MSAVLDYKRKVYAIRDLPTLPVIAQKLLLLVDDDETGPKKLADLISSDQALSAKVLRLANSAYYGHRAQIGTIHHAVTVIGTDMLKQLSLGVVVCGMMGKGGRNRTEFWKHSFATAMASAMIARKKNIAGVDVCFMAGLLHDVGQLIIDMHFPDDLEIDHTEVGGWIAERWQLPAKLISAIAHHHSMEPEHLAERIVACVHAGNICANLALGHGDQEIAPEVLKALGMTRSQFMDTVAELRLCKTEINKFLA